MAESVVSFLLDQLSTLLREEGKLLGGLRNDIQEIKDELAHMRAFLRVAEANEEDDPRLQEWIRQVREAAYDTEDILDEFMLRFAFNRRDGFIGRIFSSLKNLRARHRIASEVQHIKKRITDIFERHQRYQSEYGTNFGEVSEYVAPNKMWRFDRDDALLVEESKLEGIDGPRKLLISQLIDRDSQLKVVSVFGMGGLGKTTLVRRVYEDSEMRRKFQVRAWITVSQTVCQVEDLLKDLIEQFRNQIKEPNPQEINSMRSDGLKMYLKNLLQDKRYVIVFDDVWDTAFWNNIKFALPEGGCGNRVILTTRNSDVACAPHVESHGYLHKMQPLSFAESWTLFCKKTFEDHSCPPHLKNVCESILGKCEGLPLAIVVISGFLALKDKNNLKEWEMVRRSLGAELEGSGKLDRIKKVLSLSYNELPYYLKTCLLYLSIFPEDYQIPCQMLIRLWIAERFVEQKGGMTVEEVGQGYLRELINRSLIQVMDPYADGEPTFCRIHDLLREILLSKSRELNIMTISTAQNKRWPEKVRRLATHSCPDNLLELQEGNYFKHLRSVITFRSMEPLSKPFIDKILRGGSKILKILDLWCSQIYEIPDEVFNLLHLRYLSLKGTRIKIVPKAIGKLHNLEYLNVSETQVSELPKEILKLQKLCQLMVFREGNFSEHYTIDGFKAPFEIGRLRSLQRLKCMEVDSTDIVSEIGKLTQLSKLSIAKLRSEDGEELCSSLQKLTSLFELEVCSIQRDEIIDLDHCAPSSLQSLQRLYLRGRLENMPRWISSLQGLTTMALFWSELKDDPLESLQHLPNLLRLYLCDAYQGEGLCFKAGGFLKLKKLTLRKSGGIKWARVEEGAMPQLQELRVEELKLLKELPCGIQYLSNLRHVYLMNVNDNLIAKLLDGNEGSEERRKIAHVPRVEIFRYISHENTWQVHYL